MMSTRRSLFFVTGVLMAVLVLGSTAAFAQTVSIAAVNNEYDKVLVTWTGTAFAPASGTLAAHQVGYIKTTTADEFGAGTPVVKDVHGGDDSSQYLITGLDADTTYLVGVRGVAADGADPGAWSYDIATPPAEFPRVKTGPAPKPDNVDDRDVKVTPGDRELMVEWREPATGASRLAITKYQVEFSQSKAFSPASAVLRLAPEPTTTMATISNLTNGTMYYVRIRAVNSQGGMSAWSTVTDSTAGMPSADAMPTPALPVFGAIALGAGLVAAGRRRLRSRRRQHLLNS